MSVFKVKTIVVTGAGGFLGQELVRQLISHKKYNVIALTSQKVELNETFGKISNLEVLDAKNWLNEINKEAEIDVLFNCAFPRSSNPKQLVDGINFTEKVMGKSLELKIPKVINISSQSVYSQKEKTLANESSPVFPESLYGMTKYTAERIVSILCESAGEDIHYSNIRLASLTGIGLKNRMLHKFVKKALNKESITINGGGKLISYLHVKDAASALISMISTDSKIWKPIYNLGNHYSYSLLEIAEIVNSIANEHSVNKAEIILQEDSDDFNNLINSELFYSDFEWKPNYDMPLMVDELFGYYKNLV